MERQNVESTMIVSMGYDRQTAILEIVFKSDGEVWQYYEVPDFVFEEFINSDSKGRFFLKNIRGKYHDTRVG